jgi:hypothetical protein
MNNVAANQSELALFTLYRIPESIREWMLGDAVFRARNGIGVDAQLTMGNGDLIVMQSVWFASIKSLFANRDDSQQFKDTSGQDWTLIYQSNGGEPMLHFSSNEKTFFRPAPVTLLPDHSERLASFERQVESINLPEKDVEQWRSILVSRPLNDEEFGAFERDCANTPITVAQMISTSALDGSCEMSMMVPTSASYYVRLIGNCGISSNISDYAQQGLLDHVKQLIEWRRFDGFLTALLLSSHSCNSSLIDTTLFSDEEICDAYKWIEKRGDIISLVGGIEVGLAIIDQRPILKPFLIKIINKIIDEATEAKNNRFHLLSALFILVDGELARTKILSERPPFWRRLAALAQASIIERSMVRINIDIANFSDNAIQSRGQFFFLQNFLDLRREPRWHPNYAMAAQLKAEFIGRIMSAATTNASKVVDGELHALLFGDAPESIQSLHTFPDGSFPGPLEGSLEQQADMPLELIESIETQLNASVLQGNSFAALLNFALIFRLDSQQVELVGKALRTAKYQIKQVRDSNQLQSILYGLATVAAVTRNGSLAEDVMILARNFGQQPEISISPTDAMAIGLVAAAAYPELVDWCKFVGKWMTELAFYPLKKDQAARLQVFCRRMCHIVPELWQTCGKADAALEACLQ